MERTLLGLRSMTQSNDLPSLFGRFTTILRDHEHLATTLRRLRLMCARLEGGQTAHATDQDPPTLFAELRADLEEHFEAEESPAYFGIVMSEDPALATQVAELKWEHLAMLHETAKLCELSLDPERLAELPAPTRALIAQLEGHERSESELLRKLFRRSR